MRKLFKKIAELFGFRKEKEYVVIVGDLNKPWDRMSAPEPAFCTITTGRLSPDDVE